MQELIDAIRAATAPDATPEQKGAGLHACRTIAAALDTEPGKPLPMPIAAPVPVAGRVSLDQLLDLVIARLDVIANAREQAAPPSSPASAMGAATVAPTPAPPSAPRRARIPIAAMGPLKGATRASSPKAHPRPQPARRVVPSHKP